MGKNKLENTNCNHLLCFSYNFNSYGMHVLKLDEILRINASIRLNFHFTKPPRYCLYPNFHTFKLWFGRSYCLAARLLLIRNKKGW